MGCDRNQGGEQMQWVVDKNVKGYCVASFQVHVLSAFYYQKHQQFEVLMISCKNYKLYLHICF